MRGFGVHHLRILASQFSHVGHERSSKSALQHTLIVSYIIKVYFKKMNTDLRNKFGYPISCNLCNEFEDKPQNIDLINPFYKTGESVKVLLIGQDPTILDRPERVNTVLMLNETTGRNGQLRKWLESELFGKESFQKIEIYATNLVKCQFSKPPSTNTNGALKFLEPRFDKCKHYLYLEIESFRPNIILTLGESSHILFSREIELLQGKLNLRMKDDFNGEFCKVRLNSIIFEYSPCLHIKTFRVAETYGKQVFDFKNILKQKIL